MFIVFEGINGTGKTTALELTSVFLKYLKAEQYLQGVDEIIKTKEPTNTLAGRNVKKALAAVNMFTKNDLLALIKRDRQHHLDEVIKPNRHKSIILSDRYWYSTYAYQAQDTPELDKKLHNDLVATTLQPDICFLLVCDVNIAKIRAHNPERWKNDNDVVNQQNMENVQQRYFYLARQHSEVVVLQTEDFYKSDFLSTLYGIISSKLKGLGLLKGVSLTVNN